MKQFHFGVATLSLHLPPSQWRNERTEHLTLSSLDKMNLKNLKRHGIEIEHLVTNPIPGYKSNSSCLELNQRVKIKTVLSNHSSLMQ